MSRRRNRRLVLAAAGVLAVGVSVVGQGASLRHAVAAAPTRIIVALTHTAGRGDSEALDGALGRDGLAFARPVFAQHADWNIEDVNVPAGVDLAAALAAIQSAPDVRWAEQEQLVSSSDSTVVSDVVSAAALGVSSAVAAPQAATPVTSVTPAAPPAAPPTTCTGGGGLAAGQPTNPLYCNEPNGPYYAEEWNAFCFVPSTQSTSVTAAAPTAPKASGICADGAWRLGAQGQGTVVAILDSGVDYTHPNLKAQMADETNDPLLSPAANPTDPFLHNGTASDGHIHGWNFYDENAEPMDYFGHGTGRAGIAAAQADINVGLAGIAPRAHILAVKVGDTYVVTSQNLAEGAVYAADHGADTINTSLGVTGNSLLLRTALQYTYSKGIFWASATANEYSTHHNVVTNLDTIVGAGGLGPDSAVQSTQTCQTAPNINCAPATAQQTFLQKVNYANYGGIQDFALPIDTPSTVASASACHGDPLPGGACAGQGAYSLHNSGTSTATPHLAAAANVVRSAGFLAGLCQGHPNIAGALSGINCTGPTLSSNELRQLLAYTALRIHNDDAPTGNNYPASTGSDPSLATAGNFYPEQGGDSHLGWNIWSGYGRPDLYAASAYAEAGLIPPEAQLFGDAPPPTSAYAGLKGVTPFGVYDPTTTPTVPIVGHVAAPRAAAGQGVSWKVQVAPCLEPLESDFTTIHTGSGAADGVLATWQLPATTTATCANASLNHPFSYPGTYTVRVLSTLIQAGGTAVSVADPVAATDPNYSTPPAVASLQGQDRRVVFVRPHAAHDHASSPYYVGQSGEGSPTLYDLEGRGQLDIIMPGGAGQVLALRPDGTPVPGWPASIDDLGASGVTAHPETVNGSPISSQIVGAVAVGNLLGDGRPVVVASAVKGGVYAWFRDGSRVPGFPVSVAPPPLNATPATGFTTDPTKDAAYCSSPHPAQYAERYSDYGGIASPVLANVEKRTDGGLDIVVAEDNGCVYVLQPSGAVLWKRYLDSSGDVPYKIAATPAVADLDGSGTLDVIVGTEEVAGNNGYLYALNGTTGAILTNWPKMLPSISASGVPTVAAGVISSPAVLPSQSTAGQRQVVTGSFLSGTDPQHPIASYNADASTGTTLDTKTPGTGANATDLPLLYAVAQTAVGTLQDNGGTNHLSIVFGGLGPLLAADTASAPGLKPNFQHMLGAYDASSGSAVATFPRQIEDWQFLAGPVIADVKGDGTRQVIEGSGGGFLHAFDPNGTQGATQNISTTLVNYGDYSEPAGFPVFEGTQYITSTPAVGQLTRGGAVSVVNVTRDGWVYVTDTAGQAAANDQWWKFHHDERNTGQYGLDTRPPATPTDLAATAVSPTSATVSWTETGNDWWVGQASSIDLRWSTSPITDATFASAHRISTATPKASGAAESVTVSGLPAGSFIYLAERASDAAGNIAVPAYTTVPLPQPSPPPPPGPTAGPARGYWLVASDGGIFPFGPGAVGYGSTGAIRLNQPIVGMAATPSGHGYYLVASDGGIFPFGDAVGYGSTGGIRLSRPIVGMAVAPGGNGYWLVASDGGIFPFGPGAGGYGSTGAITLNKPIVGMAATPSGAGYWLVASDGGIFPFGDATGYGSTGAITLTRPIVGMAVPPAGGGYWLVASDGGIFPFGPGAGGYGSTGNVTLNQPIVGMAPTFDGRGYYLAASDGGIFPFGDAGGYGSTGGMHLNQPVVGLAARG